MDNFYRGYVVTKNKEPLMKFGKNSKLLPYDEVKGLTEYAGVIGEDYVLVDIDKMDEAEILLRIVKDKAIRCHVLKTTHGMHFIFRNVERRMDINAVHVKSALGVTIDIKAGFKNSIEILKMGGSLRPVLNECEDPCEVPRWLLPVKTDVQFLGMDEGEGRNNALFSYILTLSRAGLDKEEIIECIHLMNDYILKDPLKPSELKTILRDEAFKKTEQGQFYRGDKFLHYEFAEFIIREYHVKKVNNVLHLYKDGIYQPAYNWLENVMIDKDRTLKNSQRMEVTNYIKAKVCNNTPAADANYIAFRNGVYDIVSDKLVPFTPDLVITNKVNWDYSPKAYSALVDSVLNKISLNDPTIRMLLEEVVGYTFYRRNELRKSFILIGDKANGKSTYLDMIKHLLGDENTSALDLKELGDRFKTSELFGKLANIGDDIGDEFIANPAVFKKLSAGDRVNVERKGLDPFDFNSFAKLLFSANNIPRIKDKTGAVMDRLIIVPFDARFSRKDPDYDPYIKYKLRKEECMEYLVQLGIQGLKRVLENRGFTTSTRVTKELEEYEETNNPILLFFKDLDFDVDVLNQPTKRVYTRYSEFCIGNNFQPMSKIEFSKQVKKRYDGLTTAQQRAQGMVCQVFVKK